MIGEVITEFISIVFIVLSVNKSFLAEISLSKYIIWIFELIFNSLTLFNA